MGEDTKEEDKKDKKEDDKKEEDPEDSDKPDEESSATPEVNENEQVEKCGCKWTCAIKGCPITKQLMKRSCSDLAKDFKVRAGASCTGLNVQRGIKDASGTFKLDSDKPDEESSATPEVKSKEEEKEDKPKREDKEEEDDKKEKDPDDSDK